MADRAAEILELALFGQNEPFDDYLLASWAWFCGPGQGTDTNTNIIPEAVALLIEEFKTRPRIVELVAIIAKQFQILEFVAADLMQIKNLNTASGDQLDILGENVAVAREGKTDIEYREAIRLRGFINRSNGEPEVIIEYARALTTPTDIEYLPQFPGKVLLQIVTAQVVTPATTALIQKIAPAGVKIILEVAQEGDVFGFDGEGGVPAAVNIKGFGEEGIGNESIGGKFIEEV